MLYEAYTQHLLFFTDVSTGSGGAVYVGGSLVLDSCELASNECSINGDAVFKEFGATAKLVDCKITDNRAGQSRVSILLDFHTLIGVT
jgi:predicted outer membrane repeat protein